MVIVWSTHFKGGKGNLRSPYTACTFSQSLSFSLCSASESDHLHLMSFTVTICSVIWNSSVQEQALWSTLSFQNVTCHFLLPGCTLFAEQIHHHVFANFRCDHYTLHSCLIATLQHGLSLSSFSTRFIFHPDLLNEMHVFNVFRFEAFTLPISAISSEIPVSVILNIPGFHCFIYCGLIFTPQISFSCHHSTSLSFKKKAS